MLRDMTFLRRNPGEEAENLPVNPKDSSAAQVAVDSLGRPPLNVIQEPVLNLKGGVDQEGSAKVHKSDRTPTKPKAANPTHNHRTPEKQGVNKRFGWGQKGESSLSSSSSSSSVAVEMKDEGRADVNGGSYSQLRSAMANFITPRPARNVGRANSEGNSTQTTPTKSLSKPPNPGFCLTSGSKAPPSSGGPGGSRMSNYAALSKGISSSCSSNTVVNTVEVPHFELKEDPSFWLEHNVQVLIRVRPLSNAERGNAGYNRCLKQESAQTITWIGQPETRFTFDHVACESIDQETLFRMVGLPMVENCLSGYNSCMFAYGQTGSGKTHTMLGDIEDLEIRPSTNRGMTPRIFEFLFARIRAEEESRRDEKLRYHCRCSFLEIYNEQIADLLDPSSTNLMLREDMKKGVYVENLSAFEVQTVGDILKLLREGSLNRRVAATNMNRESSRSHSVFTCEIESRWEKDSTSNFRFARLNLVDLAGSERQKTSGAEGERLKEAANINKSLSTLGHVIMVLVDVANGRQKHIPYRDSRLTFLLQDSLGGNSKTMIIANVSPSSWCAAETLNTLKFAQRAKLIQNNAVVNEDSSGDVVALQNQIRLLKEELCILKRQNVSRSLSFGPADEGIDDEHRFFKDARETNPQAHLLSKESKGILRVSTKQMKSLESTLTGALRREQMAEISIKQLEAENEQLNRLVQQREEDTRCTKMMLKFREDKIQRMESLVRGIMPADVYLQEENCTLSSEIQLLQAKIEKNPEVTRFALENIRLLEQLRRFQDFYEEGEREMLLVEVSQLREQFILCLDGNLKQHHQEASNASKENVSIQQELKRTQCELEECRSKLNSCLEYNAKLSREVDTLRFSVNFGRPLVNDHESSAEVIKESISEAPSVSIQPMVPLQKEKKEIELEKTKDHVDEVLHLQLELDILKTILKEERSFSHEREENMQLLGRDLDLSKEKVLLVTKQYEAVKEELKEAQSVIEALESQQLLSIDEIEDLRGKNCYFEDLINKQELELSSFKLQNRCQEFRSLSSSKILKREDFLLEDKLNKMHDSLEKSKRLNKRYQSDKAFQASHEEEVEEVRRQVEAETAEVIVCLQEELSLLQEEVQASNLKEMETKQSLALLQTEMQAMGDKFSALTGENTELSKLLEDRDSELRKSSQEWELLTNEIEAVLQGGFESLKDASDQLHNISNSFPQKRSWISAQFDKMTKCIFEKEVLIEELNHYLEDASSKRKDMECMLNSLRGAALAMNEAHQQECCEKDREMFMLTSQLSAEASTVLELKNKLRHGEAQLRKTSTCATAALITVNRLSELNSKYLDELNLKDTQLMALTDANVSQDTVIQSQNGMIDEAKKQIQSHREDIKALEASCSLLGRKLSEEQNSANSLRQELEAYEEDTILQTGDKLSELKNGVSEMRSCIAAYVDGNGCSGRHDVQEEFACLSSKKNDEIQTGSTKIDPNDMNSHFDKKREGRSPNYAADIGANMNKGSSGKKNLVCQRLKDVKNREATIMLLKAEIESALESLKGVQTEIVKLRSEKNSICVSEQESRKGIESIVAQVLVLRNAMDYFEDEVKVKIRDLEGKLLGFERVLEDSCNSWFEQKELLEEALGDASLVSTQKDAEASYILSKFEEIQYTMKDADIMINELMIANETLKLEVSELKKKEASLVCDRDCLVSKVQSLQSVIDQKDGQLKEVEVQLGSDFETINKSLQELEVIVSQVQSVSMEECLSIASDCLSTKSQFHESVKLLSAGHEDIWSDIILKDTAVSVLHICHLGILLEKVTGLNAENGILSHGLGESNEAISELRKQNYESMKELESCRILQGKMLADIKNSFDRISRQEDEAGELRIKLRGFEQKVLDLESEKELTLQRSTNIGAELNVLLKDLDHSKKEKERLLETREEDLLVEMCARDFEVLIFSSHLEQVNSAKADLEKAQLSSFEVLDTCKESVVLHAIDASLTESILLEREAELCSLSNNFKNLGRELQDLLSELETRDSTIAQMEDLNSILRLDVESLKDVASLADELKSDLDEATKAKQMLSLQVEKLNSECGNLTEEKKIVEAALEVSSRQLSSLEDQKKKLEDDNCLLESYKLEKEDLELRKLNSLEHEEKMLQAEIEKVKAEYCSLFQDLEDKKDKLESSLRDKAILDAENQTLQDRVSLLENQSATLQMDLEAVKAEVEELQTELLRKDDLLNGALFDMSVLQESASISMDQKEEIGSLLDSLGALQNELVLKSANLDKTVKMVQDLEAQLKEKIDKISTLENDIAKEQEIIFSLTSLNHELVAKMEDCTKARESLEEELLDRKKVSEDLEVEMVKMEMALGEMNSKIEFLESNLNEVTTERDDLQERARVLKQELEMAQTIAEENRVLANEAQEGAEIRRVQIEEKEEEVKLLERSVEELERTVDVLENQFEILKVEADRQRLEREELEGELHAVKQQMQSVENFDADMRRKLDDNEKNLEESLQLIQILEKERAARDAEVARCKVHIDELNLHAEAQASEYKQKFKVLESMLEQVKQEVPASANSVILSANKLEKNGSKSRGSGSPFKCIGLGIAQQIKSEKEEELSARRRRIEELEALAASRQKEIFMLNARLATAESMTHDVIRDLLGLKLDMNSCATLMNNKQVQVLMDKAQSHNIQEEEVIKLKEQLNEFVKERKGWIEEIDRKQAEVVTAQVALEKLRQRDQLLTTENQMLKVESSNYKKRAMELEAEIKKLSGQQNLQQRIHHHTKIKEENNMLKCHNDELSAKLRRTDSLLLRVKQELAQYRAAGGRNPHIDFDEEERLNNKLKETETERFQLAHELISLCTSILKAAGITRPPTSEINRPVAEEALDQLKSRINALERELQAAKMKNRMNKERMRLSELMPGSSTPLSSRTDYQQSPYLSSFDR